MPTKSRWSELRSSRGGRRSREGECAVLMRSHVESEIVAVKPAQTTNAKGCRDLGKLGISASHPRRMGEVQRSELAAVERRP
jgi:hypothetical protein